MDHHSSALRLVVRRATVADFEAIVSVWEKSGLPYRPQGRDTKEAFTEQLALSSCKYFVAVCGEEVVGVVLGTHDGRKGWINRLAVVPEFQRQGVARRLLGECESALNDDGIEIVAALIEGENDCSPSLFERAGFSEYGPIRYFRKLKRDGV